MALRRTSLPILGKPVDVPSLYDEMSERAYPGHAGGSAGQRRQRDLLRARMEADAFSVHEYEWWQFGYRGWKSYAMQNVRFENIAPARAAGSR